MDGMGLAQNGVKMTISQATKHQRLGSTSVDRVFIYGKVVHGRSVKGAGAGEMPTFVSFP